MSTPTARDFLPYFFDYRHRQARLEAEKKQTPAGAPDVTYFPQLTRTYFAQITASSANRSNGENPASDAKNKFSPTQGAEPPLPTHFSPLLFARHVAGHDQNASESKTKGTQQ